MGTLPAEPCALVAFTPENFSYKAGKLEQFARQYAAAHHVSPAQSFFFGVDETQCEFGVFRSFRANCGATHIEYEKSFPWGCIVAGVPDAGAQGDRKYVADMLAHYDSDPQGTIAYAKGAFVTGPTLEMLTQRVTWNTFMTIQRHVTLRGFQTFAVSASVEGPHVETYQELLRAEQHPYRKILRLTRQSKPGVSSFDQKGIPSLDDVPSFLALNERFASSRAGRTQSE